MTAGIFIHNKDDTSPVLLRSLEPNNYRTSTEELPNNDRTNEPAGCLIPAGINKRGCFVTPFYFKIISNLYNQRFIK
jgi:hypothetical protein